MFNDTDFKANSIVRCEIPIKANKKIGYTGLKQSKSDDIYYVCHHEILMVDETKLNDFLNNKLFKISNGEKSLEEKNTINFRNKPHFTKL